MDIMFNAEEISTDCSWKRLW